MSKQKSNLTTTELVDELMTKGWEPVSLGAKPWEQGLRVVGTFVGVRESAFVQDDGTHAKQVLIRDEDGIDQVFRCPAVLARKVSILEPGDEVLIECVGKVRTKANRQAWDFVVMTK